MHLSLNNEALLLLYQLQDRICPHVTVTLPITEVTINTLLSLNEHKARAGPLLKMKTT